MKLDYHFARKTIVIRISGELDMVSADDFRKEVDALMEKNCSDNIVLNLEGIEFIDSSGLGVILGRYKKASLRGGKMAIVGAPLQVKRILELSGILRIAEAFATEKEALEAI